MVDEIQQFPFTLYGHEEDNIFLSLLLSSICQKDQSGDVSRTKKKKKEAPVRAEHLLGPKLLQEIKLSQIIFIVIIIAPSLSVNNRKPVFFEAQVDSVIFLWKFQTEQSQKRADIIWDNVVPIHHCRTLVSFEVGVWEAVISPIFLWRSALTSV